MRRWKYFRFRNRRTDSGKTIECALDVGLGERNPPLKSASLSRPNTKMSAFLNLLVFGSWFYQLELFSQFRDQSSSNAVINKSSEEASFCPFINISERVTREMKACKPKAPIINLGLHPHFSWCKDQKYQHLINTKVLSIWHLR